MQAPTNHPTFLLDTLGLANLNIILLWLIFNEITLCRTHPEAAEQEKPYFYSSKKLKCLRRSFSNNFIGVTLSLDASR